MTTYHWPTIRADAIARFGGDAPRAELEQRIINVFELQPQLVVLAIDKITDAYRAGQVRSPWAVVATHIERASTPGADIQATDTNAKQKAIARAEAWIKVTGMHYDRPDEITLELFGHEAERGRLRDYAQVDLERTGPEDDQGGPTWQLGTPRGDTKLVERMLDLWANHRPTGMQVERDAEQRAADWKDQQARKPVALEQAHTELATVVADDNINFD